MKKLILCAVFALACGPYPAVASFDDGAGFPGFGGGGSGATPRGTLRLSISANTSVTVSQAEDNAVIFLNSSVVPVSAKVFTSGSGPWDCSAATWVALEDDFSGVIEVDLSGNVPDLMNITAMDLGPALEMFFMNPDFQVAQDDPGPGQVSVETLSGTQIRAVTPAGGGDCNAMLGFQTSYQSGTPPAEVTFPAVTEDGLAVAVIAPGTSENITLKQPGGANIGTLNAGSVSLFYWDNNNSLWIIK